MSPDLLVRYARLKKAERNALYELSVKNSPVLVLDRAALKGHLDQVVNDRLAFSQRFVACSARHLASAGSSGIPDPEMDMRMALGRAYYAAHHALRALHVELTEWDPDGHKETVVAIGELCKTDSRIGPRFSWLGTVDLSDAIADLLEERHVADYHFYGRDVGRTAAIDFMVRAPQAHTLAQNIVETVSVIIADNRSGKL